MDLALLLARLILAGVFAVAGIAKLMDRDGARAALTGFGVPERLARPLAVSLPVVELGVALALLPLVTAFWGAIGALVLLGLFVIGIALSMARGEAPDCHCFGQLHSEPAGWRTLIRNAALALVTLFVLVAGGARPGSSLTGWLGDLSGAEQFGLVFAAVLAFAVSAQAWFLFQLMAQNGRLLSRVEALESAALAGGDQQAGPALPKLPDIGLPIGAPAPAFSLAGLYGETTTLEALLAPGKPSLLLFTDPNCAPCNALLPEVARWQREHRDDMTVAIISRRELEANRSKAEEHGLRNVLVQQDMEVYGAFQARGTPSAVFVRPDGIVASPVAGGARQIERLVEAVLAGALEPAPTQHGGASATNGHGEPPGLASARRPAPAATLTARPPGGQALPDIALPDADGNEVRLSAFQGRPTVLLFWNPGCGFCQRMVGELETWARERPPDAPGLAIISSGGVDGGPVSRLGAPYLLDDGFAAGRQFGASGTPSAVLIDSAGKLASNVMVGADKVLSLLDPARRMAQANGNGNGNGTLPPLAPMVRLGSPVPAFRVPDLDGNMVDASALSGQTTLVLFWDPNCGFCQRMADDLRALEADAAAPPLFVISTGTPDVNRALGLKSTIVLDEGFTLGRSFSASGTPSAMLVDRKGRVASAIAAGAPAILDLAREARRGSNA